MYVLGSTVSFLAFCLLSVAEEQRQRPTLQGQRPQLGTRWMVDEESPLQGQRPWVPNGLERMAFKGKRVLATRKAFKRKRVREIPAARKSARKAAPETRARVLATRKALKRKRVREIPAARKSARKAAPATRAKLAAKKSAPLSAPSQSLHENPHTDATEISSNHVEMTLFRDVGYQCMLSLLDLFVVIVVMILSLWLLMGTRDS